MPQALRPASQLALAGSFETSDLAAPSNALNPDDAANELPDAIADTVEDVQFAPSFEWSREASVFGSLKISTFGLALVIAAVSAYVHAHCASAVPIKATFSYSSVTFCLVCGECGQRRTISVRYQTACAELLALFGRASDQDDVDIVLDPAENQEYQTLVKGFGSSLLTILNALICGDRNQVYE